MKVLSMQLQMIWNTRILRSILLLGIACLLTGVECKRSACYRYGHVCWGGHGKRSGQSPSFPPASGSIEMEGGTGSFPVYSPSLPLSETAPAWKMSHSSKQFGQLPLVMNPNLNMREQPFSTVDAGVLHNQKNLLKHFLNPMRMMRPIERQGSKAPVAEDALLLPSEAAMSMSSSAVSREVPPAFSGQSIPGAIFKRASSHKSETEGAHGTEEPLETSSNGLDSSGSVATFFRDRKSSANTNRIFENFDSARYRF